MPLGIPKLCQAADDVKFNQLHPHQPQQVQPLFPAAILLEAHQSSAVGDEIRQHQRLVGIPCPISLKKQLSHFLV